MEKRKYNKRIHKEKKKEFYVTEPLPVIYNNGNLEYPAHVELSKEFHLHLSQLESYTDEILGSALQVTCASIGGHLYAKIIIAWGQRLDDFQRDYSCSW